MKYRTKVCSISSAPISAAGPIRSLCTFCKNKNCSNNIVKKSISIFGMNEQQKLLMRANDYYCVVDCEGFSSESIDGGEG